VLARSKSFVPQRATISVRNEKVPFLNCVVFLGWFRWRRKECTIFISRKSCCDRFQPLAEQIDVVLVIIDSGDCANGECESTGLQGSCSAL
jgi:hypothetical protein